MVARRWTKRDEKFLIRNHENFSQKELAEKYDVSPSTIRRKLEELGVFSKSAKAGKKPSGRSSKTAPKSRSRAAAKQKKTTSGRNAAKKAAARKRTKREIKMPEPEVTQPSPPPLHERVPKSFEKGVRHFYQKEFEKAEEAFQEVISHENIPRLIIQRAENYLKVARQSKESTPEISEVPDEMILRAVYEGNQGNTSVAKEILVKVKNLAPDNDKVHYLLANTAALEGDAGSVVEHLEEAIRLNESNRTNAKFDVDFEELREDPTFAELVGIEVGAPLTPKPTLQKSRTILESPLDPVFESSEAEETDEAPASAEPTSEEPSAEPSDLKSSLQETPEQDKSPTENSQQASPEAELPEPSADQ